MEHRKQINDQLVQWIRRTAESQFPEDISLAVVYGSWLSGTMHRFSDVDCYFIPKTDRGLGFARTFLLDDVGYDIFPMSWQRLEEIARLSSPMQPLLGDISIVYCGDKEALQRFQSLQKQMRVNLTQDDCVRQIAASKCREAAQLLAETAGDAPAWQVRKTAGQVSITLSYALAVVNHQYHHLGLKKQYDDLERIAPWAAGYYRSVAEAETAEAARRQASAFLKAVCSHLDIPLSNPEPAPKNSVSSHFAPEVLAELYQEICSTFRKIYISCETGNHILAYVSAVSLQQDLEDAIQFGCPVYPLLETYDHRQLPRFAEDVRRIETHLIRLIESGGTTLKHYASYAMFEKENRTCL